jgi:acetolactate synthase-1/3 small subunit
MQPIQSASDENTRGVATLRLLVRNHAGVMSHVCGLFGRRAFNLEGILCVPAGDGNCSTILLAVDDDPRLEQLMRQLAKLEDVLEIRRAAEGKEAFAAVARCLGASPMPVALSPALSSGPPR